MESSLLAPGLHVSKLCLGTMTFGEQNSYSDAAKLLSAASNAGINFFDTAEMYPVPQRAETHGTSELYLGRWMKQFRIPRDKVVVATKVSGPSGQMTWIRGGPHSVDRRNIAEAIETSLQRLGTDYIDLYQIHWPDRYVPMFGDLDYDPLCAYGAVVPMEEQLTALADAIASGQTRWSKQRNSLWTVQILQHTAAVQVLATNYLYSECLQSTLVSLLAYSPLAMGLLTGKYMRGDGGPVDARLNLYRGRYTEAECRYDLTKPNLVPAIQAYMSICQRYDLSPVELAIGFVMRHPLLGSAVIGATKQVQLEEVISAAGSTRLSQQVVDEINRVHQRYPNPAP